MKKNVVLCFFTIFLVTFISCCSFFPALKKDSELISDFKPLEWNDDYVFGATLYPPRISVWNSQNNKLVRYYDFFKATSEEAFFNNEGRWLKLHIMQVIDRCIWFIAFGNQCSLVRIDVESGKIKFIDLGKSYDYLEYISEADNGKGAILVVPFAQYMQNFNIKLFNLNGDLLNNYTIPASDLDILTAKGQYKDGCYYFCASTHKDTGPGEPSSGIYKIIKINLISGANEVITLQTKNLLEKDFIKKNMPSMYNEQYAVSFSVKPGNSSNCNYMIAVDFVGFNIDINGYDVGRFLFETDDLLSGNFFYTGKNTVYSVDDVKVFPRMYLKIENQYSMIANDMYNLYAVFFNDSNKDIFFMPNSEVIFMDEKDDIVWCSKNTYSYSKELKKWVYDKECIYKVDLRNKSVSLCLKDGSCTPISKMN